MIQTQSFPIKAKQYPALLQRVPDYYRGDDGKPNGNHVIGVLRKANFKELTDANLPEAEETLKKYAEEKTKRVLGVTIMSIDQPMTDEEYELYQSLRGYTAASLRALALFFNGLRKNREAMKALSEDMHTDVRRWARAVEYFRPYFCEEQSYLQTTDEYELLFRYARLKRVSATVLFAERKFSLTPQLLDELIDKILETERADRPKRMTDKRLIDMLQEKYDGDLRKDIASGLVSIVRDDSFDDEEEQEVTVPVFKPVKFGIVLSSESDYWERVRELRMNRLAAGIELENCKGDYNAAFKKLSS